MTNFTPDFLKCHHLDQEPDHNKARGEYRRNQRWEPFSGAVGKYRHDHCVHNLQPERGDDNNVFLLPDVARKGEQGGDGSGGELEQPSAGRAALPRQVLANTPTKSSDGCSTLVL